MARVLDQGLDAMIEVENVLLERLSSGMVDGHDAGSGEIDMFIHTDHPVLAFQEAAAVLGSHDFWVDARVAYRETAQDGFTVLWPMDLTDFKVA